jgi:Protein of unknown function (DUF3313)
LRGIGRHGRDVPNQPDRRRRHQTNCRRAAGGGFLPNPSLLQSGGTGQADLVYRSPTANFASYNKVILEPVAIWAAPDSQLNTVPVDQRQAAANAFYSDLYKALSKRCQMVTSPSPGTMRMRFARRREDNGVGYFAGNATAEGCATDATSGGLLWEAVDKRGGTTAMVENTLNNWNDIDHAFQAWSEQLASRMQELGACSR